MAGATTQATGHVGGLVGSAGVSHVDSSYWYSGGVMPAVVVGTGTLATSDHHDIGTLSYFYQSTNAPLSSWDFVNVWNINAGSALPFL